MNNVELAMSISDTQVDELYAAAVLADDRVQMALCVLASGADLPEDLDDTRADLEEKGVYPEHVGCDVEARALCALVIENNTKGQ